MINTYTFRKLLVCIALFASASLSNQSIAQDTWDIEGTILTEYDLVTGLQVPWEILWGPDDMIWATTRPGDVVRIDPETGSYTNVLNLNVYGGNGSEPGLLGMAMHPDWENTPKVFLVYNTESNSNITERLSVFNWNGSQLVDEEILLTIDGGGIHNGSRLLILPDNTLLMSTGDTGGPSGAALAQNLESENGKMLRLNLDGSVPSDNPWTGSYVYSWGHRNSQGLCLGPDGTIYSSEHGQSNWDEFNIIEAGRNYGWPEVEGACGGAAENAFCEEFNVREPLRSWAPCIAVNGIEYYNHPAIPAWNNCILLSVMGGFNDPNKRLSILHLSEDGLSVESEDQYFSEFNQRVRDICVNPYTGAVYMALNGPSYPGFGPNIIKEFRPGVIEGIGTIESDHVDALIYPNPASDVVTIQVSESLIGATYQLIDYSGRTAVTGPINSLASQLNVTDLARGSYYLFMQNNSQVITRTFTLN